MSENYYIKIIGKANVPEKIEIGHNYRLEIDASVTSEQKIDNENGDFDVISKVEPIHITISQDNGKTIKARDPRKNSQKIRNTLYREWAFITEPIEFEKFYDACTKIILKNAVNIVDEALQEIKK